MRLEYQNKISIEVDKNSGFAIRTGNMFWRTKEAFRPYIEVYDEKDWQVETYLWSECAKVSQEEYHTGYSRGIRTYYEGFGFDDTFSFATFVEIFEPTCQIKVGIIPVNDCFCRIKKIVWPAPLDFSERRQEYYTVYPLQQGILIPNGWAKEICIQDRWELRAEMLYARSGYMPWFGQVRGEEGYWYLVNTPFDAGFTLEHKAYEDCSVGTVWYSQLGVIGYKRESTYAFLEKCDYNTFCRLFREYLKETGELCTLEEKIIKNPAVKKLIGSAVYHAGIYTHIEPESFYYQKDHPERNDYVTTFEEMGKRIKKVKEKGFDKIFVHIDGWTRAGYDNQHPDTLPPCEKAGGWDGFRDLCDTVQDLGFQFAIHDQYRDYYLNAPSYDVEYSRKAIDGSSDNFALWYGGWQDFLCPEFQIGFVKRNFTEMKAHGVKLDGAYLDVFSCEPLDECFGTLHRVTREQCMKERKKCLDYVRSQGIIISSEEGVGWAMRDLDLIHHAPYVHEHEEDPTELCGKMLPESIGVPVPLLNLVYHDCVVTPWVIDERDNEMPNNQSGFLHALLNGGIAYVESWYTDKEIDQVKTVARWHEKVGMSEMILHEFIDEPRDVQRVTYANGAQVTVDFKNNTYKLNYR